MNSCLHCSAPEGEGQGKTYTGKIAEGGAKFKVCSYSFAYWLGLEALGNLVLNLFWLWECESVLSVSRIMGSKLRSQYLSLSAFGLSKVP